MNLPLFIARRIAKNRKGSFSRFIIGLATIATTISVAVMIIAIAVVTGFKDTIREKMFAFWGHFHIAIYNPNPSSAMSSDTFAFDQKLLDQIAAESEIESIIPFGVTPAILSTENIHEGIKVKGIDEHYDIKNQKTINYQGNFIDFQTKNYSHDIVLSQTTLNRLEKKIGDSLTVYFIDPEQEYPRIRKLLISGSYHSGMDDIDRSFALCDIRLLRRVSNWDTKVINGYQVKVKDYRFADSIADDVYYKYIEPPVTRIPMTALYPDIFNWLDLQNINARILLIIMAIVAVINMSTALLIFIMERNNMIGILKSLGAAQRQIQLIFLYHSLLVAVRGVLLGSVLGILICLIQYYTHAISLNEAMYNMSYVPIKINLFYVLLIGISTIIFCLLLLIIPTFVVRRVQIVRAIKFD